MGGAPYERRPNTAGYPPGLIASGLPASILLFGTRIVPRALRPPVSTAR